MQNKKIFIIAGEVSGDVLGAKIMRAAPGVEFIGIGGENMRAAGLKPLFPMSDLAVMGLIDVARHARTLTRRIRDAADAIIAARPDMVLTIDAPGLAKSVIRRVRKSREYPAMRRAGLEFRHVVAPQVWAWRPGRAKKFAKLFDKLYAFFEFEAPYFTKYGLDTVVVGHPIADGLPPRAANGGDKKTVALMPGSRVGEITRILPLMRDVAVRMGNGYKFEIPVVETTADFVRENIADWPVRVELVPATARYELFSRAGLAIAASGTVSVELAMMHVPAVIVYKMNPVTMWLARRIVKLKWVSLVNILMNRSIYPEFLGTDAVAKNVVDAVQQLQDAGPRARMIADLTAADAVWCRGAPAAQIIADDLKK